MPELSLNAEFQQRCEGLHRQAQRAWGRQFLGRRQRLRVAGGTEATGVTDYTAGSELRYVDWNRCARHDELVTRQFLGTEEHWVYFFVDVSPSMNLAGGEKFQLARKLTAALGYLALANHDRVNVSAYADGLVAQSPTYRGRKAAPALFQFLEALTPSGDCTRLERAVEAFTRAHPHRGLVILLSDMFDTGPFDVAVDQLRLRGFEPFLVHLVHPRDMNPAASGKVLLHDIESGGRRREFIDLQDAEYYDAAFQQHARRVRGYFHRYGLGVVEAHTADDVTTCIERIILGSVHRRHTRAGVRA
jgi:uncharacterized protein (DUF58 family)